MKCLVLLHPCIIIGSGVAQEYGAAYRTFHSTLIQTDQICFMAVCVHRWEMELSVQWNYIWNGIKYTVHETV